MDYVESAVKFVGVPWVKDGRSMSGADCYGLALLVLKDVFGKTLPDFKYDVSSSVEQAIEIKRSIEAATDIVEYMPGNTELIPGDLVLFSYFGEESHVGVYLGGRTIIHASRKKGTVIVSLSDMDGGSTIETRIKGAVRCK